MAGSGKLEEQPPSRAGVKKVHYPFWFGGSASCFAAMVTHPLDLGEYSPQWLVGVFLRALG
jgi:dicarboxylate transporter 10